MSKEIWEALARPPDSRLKQITGGRLSGMTDVNPQWRLEVMTDEFGPVGDGWKYAIEKLWTEEGTEGQKIAFAMVNVFWRRSGQEWSAPIPGIGGSMMIVKEKSGLHTNDEAYKMAVTDALSVAFKSLGVAADIYAGLWDGSKYKDQPKSNGPITPAGSCYDLLDDAQKDVLKGVAMEAMRKYENSKDLGEISRYIREGIFYGNTLNSDEIAGLFHLFKSYKTDKGRSFTAALIKWEADQKIALNN